MDQYRSMLYIGDAGIDMDLQGRIIVPKQDLVAASGVKTTLGWSSKAECFRILLITGYMKGYNSMQQAIITGDTADQVASRSEELFRQGLFCAESVLQAVAESQNIKNDLIPRIATGFCSGIARTSGLCGAASGAILAINMLCGRNDNTSTVEANYKVVRDFVRKFEAEFGSTNCYQLVGCHLDTPEGQAFFKENNLWDKCLVFTREAGRLAISSIQAATGEVPS